MQDMQGWWDLRRVEGGGDNAKVSAVVGSGLCGPTTANNVGYIKCGKGKREYVRVNENIII